MLNEVEMPRPYHLGQRQDAIDETRRRILAATREVLMADDGYARFTLDHIARQADVARKTIYYQFGSKVGLLQALCDLLAAEGGMEMLARAFQQPDPLAGLSEYVRVFAHFWDSDRLTTRHLRGLAALDPDFEQVIRERDTWRRGGLRALLQQIANVHGYPAPEALDETVNILFTLLSFETFDTLAGPERSLEEVAPVIERLARGALRLEA
jgi:AcrR family transcriptional regulator